MWPTFTDTYVSDRHETNFRPFLAPHDRPYPNSKRCSPRSKGLPVIAYALATVATAASLPSMMDFLLAKRVRKSSRRAPQRTLVVPSKPYAFDNILSFLPRSVELTSWIFSVLLFPPHVYSSAILYVLCHLLLAWCNLDCNT